jgi:transcriptional regulator with XRE-family HTH domain
MTAADRPLLGRWLHERRRARGLTARAVAQHLGLHVSAVYNIERAVHMPRFDLLDRWLALFGVDLLALVGARS